MRFNCLNLSLIFGDAESTVKFSEPWITQSSPVARNRLFAEPFFFFFENFLAGGQHKQQTTNHKQQIAKKLAKTLTLPSLALVGFASGFVTFSLSAKMKSVWGTVTGRVVSGCFEHLSEYVWVPRHFLVLYLSFRVYIFLFCCSARYNRARSLRSSEWGLGSGSRRRRVVWSRTVRRATHTDTPAHPHIRTLRSHSLSSPLNQQVSGWPKGAQLYRYPYLYRPVYVYLYLCMCDTRVRHLLIR